MTKMVVRRDRIGWWAVSRSTTLAVSTMFAPGEHPAALAFALRESGAMLNPDKLDPWGRRFDADGWLIETVTPEPF